MAAVAVSVELARRRRRLSQDAVAAALGVTQGHYSKVVRGAVPLSPKLEQRLVAWLAVVDEPPGGSAETVGKMRELAASIRSQCMELMQLAERDVLRSSER